MKPPFVALLALALCAPVAAAADQPAPPDTPAPAQTAAPAPQAPQSIQTEISNAVLQAIGSLGDVVQHGILRFQNSAHGQITFFKRFDMQVRTGPNAYRNVHLHQGTIINPRGTTLTAGQTVNVTGVAQHDGTLEANEITLQQ